MERVYLYYAGPETLPCLSAMRVPNGYPLHAICCAEVKGLNCRSGYLELLFLQ